MVGREPDSRTDDQPSPFPEGSPNRAKQLEMFNGTDNAYALTKKFKIKTRPRQTCVGSCHCGAVQFEIDTDFPELTMCDCSICRRKNALMVKVSENDFRLLAG